MPWLMGKADFGQANQISSPGLSSCRAGFCGGPAMAEEGGKPWAEERK